MSNTVEELSRLAEQVSRIYAERYGIDRDAAWYLAKLSEEMGELHAAYLDHSGQSRSASDASTTQTALEDELADLLMTTLLFARWQGIDVGSAIQRKWARHLPAS